MRILAAILAIAVAGPALAADTAAQKPGEDKDKLVCKREVPIGSLIASRKVCLTKSQWAQREKDGNEEARKMIYDNQGRPTSN
jgi:predicted secreted protein